MKFSFFLSLLWVSVSLAAIPKANMILARTSENAGSGLYQIDQEVQFPNGQDVLVLRETWLIENENNMKLLVTGVKEFKDQVAFMIQINGGVRTQGSSTRRVSEDFIERYFHMRSKETLAQALGQMKLVPGNVLSKKTPKNLKEADYQPENFVRLSRSGGVITYAFGTPALPEKDSVGFWIEQDQFVIRKFRLPSQAEVVADRYSSYARGLQFPRTRTVRWGPNQITIQTISVTGKGKEAWSSFGQKFAIKTDALNNQPAGALVEEFYKRFR